MTLDPGDVLKVILAVLFGGIIGLEREFRDKAAGLRTLIFICLGATLFTILSANLALDKDPTRIAANIVSGVGFLGAGVILRDRGRIIGLTTAAMIWLTAALGMGIGGANYGLVVSAVAAILVVLWLFPLIERWIDNIREERSYEILLAVNPQKVMAIEENLKQLKLKVHTSHQKKDEHAMRCTWEVSGPPKSHSKFIQLLLADPEIKEINY